MNSARVSLIAARKLLSDPKCWTQGAAVRTADGAAAWYGRDAVSYCIIGALNHVDACYDAFEVLYELLPNCTISGWNDDPARTHTEVLELLDTAIEAAD